MAIVSISRGSFSRGVEVAEKVAHNLGYTCIGRDLLLEASEIYNVPELALTHAIEDPPSVFSRISEGPMHYIAYMKAALLKHLREDNVVYHGLAGGFLLKDVQHVLKVRILADMEHRVSVVMDREGVESEEEARRILQKRDKTRRRWGMQLYGFDPEDPTLYDSVINVCKVTTDGAVALICDLVAQDPFRTTPESQADIEEMSLVASTEALIAEMDVEDHDVRVTARGGEVRIGIMTTRRIKDGSYSGFRSYAVKDLRDRLQGLGKAIGAKVTVELLEKDDG